MKTLCIIQARMGSSRYPGKVLKKIKDKSLIEYLLNRVKKSKEIDKIIVATGDGKENIPLLEEVDRLSIDSFAGSENDVLDRYYKCAKRYKGDIIVRITGDCPLIDSEIIDKILNLFKRNNVDYVSNTHPPTFPDGLDVEVFSFETLEKSWKEAKLESEREHVTPYIWKNKKKFSQLNFKNNENLSKFRITVDEVEDLKLINTIVKIIDKDCFKFLDIINVLKNNNELIKVNNQYKRNEGYQKSLNEEVK